MSIKKTTLAVAVVASVAALAAPASAANSLNYPAWNCLTDKAITVNLTIVSGKIKVTPATPLNISQYGPFSADDELEWVVKSRYRDQSGTRKDVVSRGDVPLGNSVSGPTTLENKKGTWVSRANEEAVIRALDLGLTKFAHTVDETAYTIVSADAEGCAPEAD